MSQLYHHEPTILHIQGKTKLFSLYEAGDYWVAFYTPLPLLPAKDLVVKPAISTSVLDSGTDDESEFSDLDTASTSSSNNSLRSSRQSVGSHRGLSGFEFEIEASADV